MRARTVSGVILIAVAAAGRSEAAEPEVVPVRIYQGHLVVAEGAIGRLAGLKLLIDTGSTPSVVDAPIARKLGLGAQPTTFTSFGRSMRGDIAAVEGLRIGPLVIGPAPALVVDLPRSGGMRLDGIVGLDVLARRTFSIDYAARALTFSPAGGEDWTAPLEIVPPFITVRLRVGARAVRLLLDTGSADIVLFKGRAPDVAVGSRWKGDKAVQYASGPARLQHLELRDVSIGGGSWGRIDAWALDQAPRGYPGVIDGVLGIAALGCRRVRFDFDRLELGCSV
jgi:predicted aspartyl protease